MTDRKRFIGGSDAAAVLGLSRWKTPLTIWAEKTGRVIPEDISAQVAVRLGNKLEQTVAEFFMEETGKKVRRINKPLVHPQYDFIAAQVDRDVVGEDAILECKTCSPWKAKEWVGEEIPQEYIIQVIHQLAVTGAAKGYIAVLIGNQDFKWKEIDRDEAAIKSLIEKEVYFWETFIVPNQMPMNVTKDDSDILFRLFPSSFAGDPVKLESGCDALFEEIEALGRVIDNAEAQAEENKNKIKIILQENEFGITDKYKVSWKTQATKRLDSTRIKNEAPEIYNRFLNETKSRVLRISKIGRKE